MYSADGQKRVGIENNYEIIFVSYNNQAGSTEEHNVYLNVLKYWDT